MKQKFLRNWFFLILLGVQGWSTPSASDLSLKVVNLRLDQPLPLSRWMYGGDFPAGKESKSLALAKSYFQSKEYQKCLEAISKAQGPLVRQLEIWVVRLKLSCAKGATASNGKGDQVLLEALETIAQHSSWLLNGPQAPQLSRETLEARLVLLEFDLTRNRNRAWSSVAELMLRSAELSSSDRARLFEIGGKLSVASQNSEAAESFFRRSLQEMDSEEIRQKLAQITGKKEQAPARPPNNLNEDLEASAEELAITKRIKAAMATSDLVAVVEDSVKLMTDFPGSRRARWAAERVTEILGQVMERRDPKFNYLRERILSQLEKAEPLRQLEWSKNLFGRGFYRESLQLAETSLHKSGLNSQSASALKIAARAAFFLGEYPKALEHFRKIVERFSGTPESIESLFHIGITKLEQREYSEGAAALERLLVLPGMERYEYPALYWLGRSLEKVDKARASEYFDRLLKKYPLTYYGLRLKSLMGGTSNGSPSLSVKENSWKEWWTSEEQSRWNRLLQLLEIGWFEEAQYELKSLRFSDSTPALLFQARLWGACFGYPEAIRITNKLWENVSDISASHLRIGFPFEFGKVIQQEGQLRNLEVSLIQGLIRQESSYQVDAISSSNAHGVMQLLPATAKELANELKMRNLRVPEDLLRPEVNIKLGTYYLAQLLKRYQGHLGLALAAYNAGIGKVNRWLEARSLSAETLNSNPGAPESELWIDELPWSETSFYVKAVLRNAMIYKMLGAGESAL